VPNAAELIKAVEAGEAARVADLIAAAPELALARNDEGISALMLARYRSDRPTIEVLLSVDPELDVHEAAALGYLDRLRALIDDPDSLARRSADGYTPLHFAAFFAKPEAARILIGAGAPVDAVADNPSRVQPLHSAAAGRQVDICRLLIAAGADVNARQQNGFTPLHAAGENGDPEMVELFLSAGANPRATTDDGRTPADLAEAAMHPDVAKRLREVASD
jgi:adenosylhomocysteine nucleosidase